MEVAVIGFDINEENAWAIKLKLKEEG
jgi:hypothetical protein